MEVYTLITKVVDVITQMHSDSLCICPTIEGQVLLRTFLC